MKKPLSKGKLAQSIVINGCGDSLWCDHDPSIKSIQSISSKGPFAIDKFALDRSGNPRNIPDELFKNEDYKPGYGDVIHLTVYGSRTKWFHYTDTQIEREVNEVLLPALRLQLGEAIAKAGWSEQGMQPEKGWDFDIYGPAINPDGSVVPEI